MPKSTSLNFTQNLNNAAIMFNSADLYSTIQVAVTAVGSNLTPGTRTFTAAGGTLVSGGAGATTFTMTAVGAGGAGYVAGSPIITQKGEYTVGNGSTASANSATVDSGSTNATFALTVGIMKLLYTASANDAEVKAIQVASTDSAARIMTVWLKDLSGVLHNLGATNIPATAGTGSGTTVTVDLLGSLQTGLSYDAAGKKVIPLKAGYSLYVSVPAVTASTYINVFSVIEEF
jgi:hypothetical protein